MNRTGAAWAVVLGLAAAGAAKADWGAMPTASGGSMNHAMGPGYGAPAGYGAPPPAYVPPPGGVHPTLMSYAAAPNERVPDRYGFLPSLRFLSWGKKKDGCNDCGTGNCGPSNGGAMYGLGAGMSKVNNGPAPQQGTLVFPNHPFVRGPRDFYMWGQ